MDIDLEESIHTFHGGEEYKFIPVISKIEHKHEHTYQFREHNKTNLKHMQGNSKPAIDLLVNGSFVKKTAYLDANTSYIFNASGTLDLDDDPLTFSWDFGDDETATGPIVHHTYVEDGVYQLWLTVSDGEDESSKHIIVRIGDQSKEHGKG